MSIISKNIENLKPNKEYIVTVRAKNNDINVLSGYTDSVRFRTPTDSTIPNAPSNLALAASFLNVLFKYTDSVDEDTAKYEYELYKQAQIEVVGGLNSIISGQTPHRTGFVQTNVFVVSVDDNSMTTSTSSVTNPVKYYGRVRSIDSAGNIGSWTNIVGSGDTPLIDEQFIGSLTAGKITAGTIGAHEIILTQPGTLTSIEAPNNKAILRSSDYNGAYNNLTNTWSAGSTGWIISGDGRAEFNNATIRGTLQFIDGSAPGSIFYGATQPSIPNPFTAKLISAISGDGTSVTYTTAVAHGLSVGKIVSLNHVIPSQYNLKNQYVTAVSTSDPYTFTVTSSATGTFDPIYSIGAEVVAGQIPEFSIWYNSTSGDNKSYIYSSSAWNQSLANVSNLNPQNQTQTGLIAGTTITGGGITLTTGGNIKGGQTAYDTGTGFFLGYSGTTHKFSIGNSAGNKLTWDGATLTIKGTLQFTDGTTPGRFSNGDALTGGSIAGLTISSTKIYFGTGTFNNANTAFYVDNSGQFSLKDKLSWTGNTLSISGAISASTISGTTISGASITGSTLKTAATGDRVEINSNDIYLYNTATSTTSIKFDGAVNAFGVIQSLNSGIQIKGSGSTTYTIGAAAGYSEYTWDGSVGRMLALTRVSGFTLLSLNGSMNVTAVTATENLNASQVQLSGSVAGYYQYDRTNQSNNWATYVLDDYYRIFKGGDLFQINSSGYWYVFNLQENAEGSSLRYQPGGQITRAGSKRSLKNDINYDISGLSIINKLKPASFTWKKTEMESEEVGKIKALHKNYGFIAEDIAEADSAIAVLEPVINQSMTKEQKEEAFKDIDSWVPSYYSETGILALAIKSIQELSERLELLENK
jgi:hypothetical protein